MAFQESLAARSCLFSPIVPCAAEGGLAVKALSRDSFVHRSLLSQQFRNEILWASEEMIYFKSADCVCRWQRVAPERCRSLFSPSRHGRGSRPEQAARSPRLRSHLHLQKHLRSRGLSLSAPSLLLNRFCCVRSGPDVFMFVYLYVGIAPPRW